MQINWDSAFMNSSDHSYKQTYSTVLDCKAEHLQAAHLHRQLAQIKKKNATFIPLWTRDATFTDDANPDLKKETQRGLFQYVRSNFEVRHPRDIICDIIFVQHTKHPRY